MRHYFNEHDPHAAAWLRELIAAGELPPGDVDERSIKDVTADDLRGYAQCHFFAGIGLWWPALRLAGWPDDRPVWSGSCPCQPFSAAGKRKGKADERHLWPDFFRLINACRPDCVFGEQVPQAVGHGWWDDLCDDVEAAGYTAWPCDLPACCIGSPTIRQRLFWAASRVSRTASPRRAGTGPATRTDGDGADSLPQRGFAFAESAGGGSTIGIRHAECEGRRRQRAAVGRTPETTGPGDAGGVLLANGSGRHAGRVAATTTRYRSTAESTGRFSVDYCHWINFADGKTRPIEPGLECLVDGVAFRLAGGRTSREGQSRTGILKGIGNAIVYEVAAAFIEAYLETEGDLT